MRSSRLQLTVRWTILLAWVVGLDAAATNWTLAATKRLPVIMPSSGGDRRTDYRGFDGSRVISYSEGMTGKTTILRKLPPTATGLCYVWWPAAAGGFITLAILGLAATRTRHVGNDPDVERYDPDQWTDEYYFLNRPGQADIQSDLFYDYRTNVDAYSQWQAWMRANQPRLLVIWGKYDLSFDPGEPERYRADVPNAQVHVLDAGHFALDTAADEIAGLVQAFVGSSRGLQARRAG